MEISAKLVKTLRDQTGAGFMDCKKALAENESDFDRAVEWLEKQALVTASKKASRIAAEGVITKALSNDKQQAILLETNTETDFVARHEDLIAFSNRAAELALQNQVNSVEALAELPFDAEKTVAQKNQELITKIGENIVLRRVVSFATDADTLGLYVHNHRIGVAVEVKNGQDTLNKELAMQIAAQNPLYITEADIPADELEKQKSIIREQLAQSHKPEDIVEQLLQDELSKYLNEVCLLNQMFIMDPQLTVKQKLTQANAQVVRFVRIVLGEGIEKEQTDFAAEVMQQLAKN